LLSFQPLPVPDYLVLLEFLNVVGSVDTRSSLTVLLSWVPIVVPNAAQWLRSKSLANGRVKRQSNGESVEGNTLLPCGQPVRPLSGRTGADVAAATSVVRLTKWARLASDDHST
jgi:hypothetical protein